MFLNILYADVLLALIGMRVIDILGVFVGVVVYEFRRSAARLLRDIK
jgi:hypothetical protein